MTVVNRHDYRFLACSSFESFENPRASSNSFSIVASKSWVHTVRYISISTLADSIETCLSRLIGFGPNSSTKHTETLTQTAQLTAYLKPWSFVDVRAPTPNYSYILVEQ